MVIIVKCELCWKDMELVDLEMDYTEGQLEVQYFECCGVRLNVTAKYMVETEIL